MTGSGLPSVSVIVCTYNRPKLLDRALRSVLSQDFDGFEVIVIDDGSNPPALYPTEDSRVRLVRTEHHGTGAARAEGLNAARGDFVAYCDDDDEWKPNHLSCLLQYLLENPEVDLVYGDSEWIYPGRAPVVSYSFDYDVVELHAANYIFVTDVMHRTDAAREAGGFDPSLQAHEDWDLWLRMSQMHVFRHISRTLAFHHWDEDCVSENGHWDQWQQVHRNQQERVDREGIAHHRRLSPSGTGSFDRSSWRPGRRELIWHSILHPELGYGSAARQLLLAVERQGVEVSMAPFGNQPAHGFARFYKPLDSWNKLAFYYDYRLRPDDLPCERIITYTMWESTLVPKEHVDRINQTSTLLYVPCRQNLETHRECGIRTPIKVLRHGIDPQRFPYLSRSRRNCFTFGSFGDLTPRKGIDVLIRAFQDEFSPEQPVRLLLNSSDGTLPHEVSDPRIEFTSGVMDHASLLEFLRQMDAFVLPSRGEGFGLCGIEAMSTGLPLIATNWGGPAEYLDSDDGYPLSYRLVPAEGAASHGVRYFGQWAEPDYEHLRYLLRWVYERPEEAAAKGRMAAARVHKEWTWDRAAVQMCKDLDDIAGA